MVDCFRAMALQRTGNSGRATEALAAALAVLKNLPTADDGDLGTDCDGWLIAQIALREARTVVGDAGAAPPGPATLPAR